MNISEALLLLLGEFAKATPVMMTRRTNSGRHEGEPGQLSGLHR